MKINLRNIRMVISTRTPYVVKRLYQQTRYTILHKHKNRWCPVCENYSEKFFAAGKPLRKDARCPFCLSLERHRFGWFYLKNYTDLFDENDKDVLHIAPEKCFEKKLIKLKCRYITADLFNPRVMIKMDITKIHFPDKYFDVILCSHVLEHVQNDREAINELFRVLKKDGWALLIVPVYSETEKTIEDPSISDPKERERCFGQKDHVRRYGIDFIDRLEESGFTVRTISPEDYLTKNDIFHMGIKNNKLFYCTK